MNKAVSLIVLIISIVTMAALPPEAEKKRKLGKLKASFQQRENCKEVVTLEIISHKRKEGKEDGCPAIAKSKIVAVVKQIKKSSLTYGDTITIEYKDEIMRCPAPVSYIPKIVEEGKQYSAYLKHVKKNIYTIAAGPWSFHDGGEFVAEFPDKESYMEVMKMVKRH